MRVYITPGAQKDYLKIFKKKVSYDGKMESFKRKQRFINKKSLKEIKRTKKHAFTKHLLHVQHSFTFYNQNNTNTNK